MDTQFWLEVWQNNDIGFDQHQVNPRLLRTYEQTIGLSPQRIFIPLCGQSIDMFWLWQQGHDIVAVEISPKALTTFFERYDIPYTVSPMPESDFVLYQAPRLKILCGDYFALQKEMLGSFDWIYDRAALIANPSNLRTAYAKHLYDLMDTHTQIWLLSLHYLSETPIGPPFSVDLAEIATLYPTFDMHCLETECFEERHILKGQGLDQLTETLYWLTPNVSQI